MALLCIFFKGNEEMGADLCGQFLEHSQPARCKSTVLLPGWRRKCVDLSFLDQPYRGQFISSAWNQKATPGYQLPPESWLPGKAGPRCD